MTAFFISVTGYKHPANGQTENESVFEYNVGPFFSRKQLDLWLEGHGFEKQGAEIFYRRSKPGSFRFGERKIASPHADEIWAKVVDLVNPEICNFVK